MQQKNRILKKQYYFLIFSLDLDSEYVYNGIRLLNINKMSHRSTEETNEIRNSSFKKKQNMFDNIEKDAQNSKEFLKNNNIQKMMGIIDKNVQFLQTLRVFVKKREIKLNQNQIKISTIGLVGKSVAEPSLEIKQANVVQKLNLIDNPSNLVDNPTKLPNKSTKNNYTTNY